MTSTSEFVPFAQVLGLTASGALAGTPLSYPSGLLITDTGMLKGMIASISLIAIPSLTDLPASFAARCWKRIYDIGAFSAPPLAISCAASFVFLALQSQFHDLSPSIIWKYADGMF